MGIKATEDIATPLNYWGGINPLTGRIVGESTDFTTQDEEI